MMTFHSQLFLESHKIPWFQPPPTTYPSEKYDLVSWDDDYSQYMEKIKFMFQTTNQEPVLSFPSFAPLPLVISTCFK